jgi:hypothetical protein
MIRRLSVFAAALLLAGQAFASYVVVLKDGTRYRAREKWRVVNGKALLTMENGSTLQLDPALIDEPMSEQVTARGLGDVKLLGVEARAPAPAKQQEPLGSITHLRKQPVEQPAEPSAAALAKKQQPPEAVPVNPAGAKLSDEVTRKFSAAYENVGIFEQKIVATGPSSLRVELTTDNEEKVFNAISATSFLMVHNAGVQGVSINLVELFMKTTTGGAAGRFQMDRNDAEALNRKTMSQKDYFIRKVIY